MSENHPLTLKQTVALTSEIELLLEYGVSLSQGHTGTPATYLEQQASIAFAKCLMSLIGFLRFVPPSKFWAKEVVEVVDLSSASVIIWRCRPDITEEARWPFFRHPRQNRM